jgi:hypothetical protein
MNRIWVGTVDDIDNTHVELKAKKFGCSAPLIKADDQVRLKTLDIRTLIGPGIPVAVFAPQPQIRSRGRPRGCDFRWYEGLNFDRLQDWLYGANRAMSVSLERSYLRSKRRTTHGHYG